MRAARKTELSPQQPAPRRAKARSKPVPAGADATPAESPALILQADLSARWDLANAYQPETEGRRWSPRRMLVVAGGASLGLWLIIGLAIRALTT